MMSYMICHCTSSAKTFLPPLLSRHLLLNDIPQAILQRRSLVDIHPHIPILILTATVPLTPANLPRLFRRGLPNVDIEIALAFHDEQVPV